MPQAAAPSVITLKFPLGTDNRSREYELPEGTARDITNMDVTRGGGLRCRDGLREVASGGFHSLFSHPAGHYALVVKDGALYRVDGDESLTVLADPVGRTVYAVLNDEVYWSDGGRTGRIRASGEPGRWGLSVPPQPIVSTGAGGLPAGNYLVAMTAVDTESGLESGSSEAVAVTLATAGWIYATTPSAPVPFRFRIYMTPPNGESSELRRVIEVGGGETVTLTDKSPSGARLLSLLMGKPIPSTQLVMFKGRLWGSSGSTVWYTSEQSPHWLAPGVSFYQFESEVLMLGTTEDGIYIGLEDRVYYLQGARPDDMTQRLVSNIGAAFGGGAAVPADVFVGQGSFPARQCAWWDIEGVLCIGKPGGVIIRPTQDRYSAGAVVTESSAYRAQAGLRQWVSVLSAVDTTKSDDELQSIDVEDE